MSPPKFGGMRRAERRVRRGGADTPSWGLAFPGRLPLPEYSPSLPRSGRVPTPRRLRGRCHFPGCGQGTPRPSSARGPLTRQAGAWRSRVASRFRSTPLPSPGPGGFLPLTASAALFSGRRKFLNLSLYFVNYSATFGLHFCESYRRSPTCHPLWPPFLCSEWRLPLTIPRR